MTTLDATEEHYLKRELLKFQLAKELQDLNNKDALRRFGFPFSKDDPKALTVGNATKESDSNEDEGKVKQESIANTDFPMCSYLLREFVMTFPLLSKNIAVDQSFWQTKVQVFFEHFMSLGFSDSYDREKATKRKKVALKLTKIILLLFNSGIGSSQEIEYYETDKFKLNDNKVRKRSKIEEFAMPTTETLQQLVTQEPMYINQWDINIIACVKESTILNNKRWMKTQSVKNTSYVSSFSKSTQALTTGTIKSITSTSKWMTKTITSSPTTLFSKLSMTGSTSTGHSIDDSSKNKHWFILKIRNKENPNEIIYTAKTYHDFKILEHNLKLESPGKKLPKLPHKTKQSLALTTKSELLPNGRVPSTPKQKIISSYEIECDSLNSTQTSIHDDGSKSNVILNNAQDIVKEIMENEGIDDGKDEDDEENDEMDDMESAFEEFEDATDSKTNTLVHEKMRTSLRQYLRRLSNDSDTADNLIFDNFLTKQNLVDGTKFSNEVKEDIKHRELVDINNLTNQLTFQKLALQKSLALQNSMKNFKTSLLKDEKYLLDLVNELRDKSSIHELSPLLQTFIEWFKIYLASMIYQMFLGNDNSYGFYTQVRKLHRLMPYTMMGQIMRFTNPMAMMKGMIDLFLAQPFGSYSLLQTMFSTILTEDLKSQTHVIKKLETIILKQSKYASQVVKCLKKFVEEDHFNEGNDDSKGKVGEVDFNMDTIHKESQTMDMPTCLIVLMKCSEIDKINNDAVTEIFESYNSWKLKEDNGLYFQHIKDLFQLYVKEKDKRLMRRLWQDPELSRLLKAMVAMIYEPMVKVFKIARMDIALKNFERFMNDLIKLMDDIINGQLDNSTQFNIIENIIHLVTKHQDSFFEFVHDVYLNDTEGIFEGFIKWISRIIRFLQKSKYGTDESQRIDLNKMIFEIELDSEVLKTQIDAVIEKKVESRKLYKNLVDTKTKDDSVNTNKLKGTRTASGEHVNAQKFMDHRWKQVSSMVMPDSTTSLGLQEGELVDLDLDAGDYDYLAEDGSTELEQKYQDILNKPLDESAIESLTRSRFEPLLKELLL
ncbi:hypothetical protein MOUN0_A01596 [Monosporozyma unispora]|nr:hypothetical protein C6P44_000397 [Kazachstania unispora]